MHLQKRHVDALSAPEGVLDRIDAAMRATGGDATFLTRAMAVRRELRAIRGTAVFLGDS
jgi:hypothetical protein